MGAMKSLLCAGLTASISVSLLTLFRGITTRDQLLENWIVIFIVAFAVAKLSGIIAKKKGE